MRTAKPASSTRIAIPIQSAINHLLGNIMGGVKHASTGESAVTTSANFMIHRHPNCDSLTFAVAQNETTSQVNNLYARVGSGVVVAFSDTAGLRRATSVFEVAYNSTDSGWTTAILSTTNRTIGSLSIWDTPRATLSTGDNRVEHEDATTPEIALTVWDDIAASTTAGPKAMISESADAWDNCKPQMVSWWADTALQVDSASWTDPFSGRLFKAKSRQKKVETTNKARFFVRAYCDASTTYSLRVTSSNPGASSDTVTITGLTNTTEAWVAPIKSVDVDATTESNLTLEAQRTAGSGVIYIRAWSGGEE
ncbi:MAG: hypothetical protein ACYTBJ_02340 [Planctomycetota bacterium]|jgi:hypothetical protein